MEATAINMQAKFDQGMTYQVYRDLVDRLYNEEKTTGPDQSEAMVHYTKMNRQRMKRLDKTVDLLPEIKEGLHGLKGKHRWLVLTESWCGDAAHIVPVLNKMTEENESIELRFILRDEHLDVMDEHLTNGGRSIPKLLMMDADSMETLAEFGPRPSEVQAMTLAYKASPGDEPYSEFSKKIQQWYNKDQTRSIQREVLALVQSID